MKKRNKNKYEYYVVFTFVRVDGSSGRGNYQISRSTPISNINDIKLIENYIMKQYSEEHFESVLIINFVRFEK